MCVSITLQLRVIIFPKSWLCHVNIVSITSQPVLDITNIVIIVVVVLVSKVVFAIAICVGVVVTDAVSEARHTRASVGVKWHVSCLRF